MATKRLYMVIQEGRPSRLVLATSRAQALRHVASDLLKVEIPSAVLAAQLAKGGTQIEDAGAEVPSL